MKTENLKDRATGSLVGLVVGDALGTTLEFLPRDTYQHITDMVGGGAFHLEPGQWTDDSSMALCIAESLLEKRQVDLHDQLQRFIRWANEGYLSSTGECFDIGTQTRIALQNYAQSRQIPGIDPLSDSSGNGSLMRLAPVPIAFYRDAEAAAEASATSSLTTHNSVEAVEACHLYGRMIAEAIQGWTKEALLAQNRSLASGYSSESLRKILDGDFLQKDRDQIKSTGYVVHTLEAALWAFFTTKTFREGAPLAVNLGLDSDTVGAVYGELAGAYYGLAGIPQEWVERLYMSERILEMAEGLYELGAAE